MDESMIGTSIYLFIAFAWGLGVGYLCGLGK
jgi:hypothetical protein